MSNQAARKSDMGKVNLHTGIGLSDVSTSAVSALVTVSTGKDQASSDNFFASYVWG